VTSFLERVRLEREREQEADATGQRLARVFCEVCGARILGLDQEPEELFGRTKCNACEAKKPIDEVPTGERLGPTLETVQASAALSISKPREAQYEAALAARMSERLCARGCGNRLAHANRTGVCTNCQQGKTEVPPRFCSREGCGKQLGANNRSGTCTGCRARLPVALRPRIPVGPAPSQQATAEAEAIREFRRVATALGLPPDDLLESWCRRWLEHVRGAAKGEVQ
jgi:hypothetical protein